LNKYNDADFASLQGGNLLEQCRSNCRGAKIGYIQEVWYADFAGAKIGKALKADLSKAAWGLAEENN
jgi:hypothetical protein